MLKRNRYLLNGQNNTKITAVARTNNTEKISAVSRTKTTRRRYLLFHGRKQHEDEEDTRRYRHKVGMEGNEGATKRKRRKEEKKGRQQVITCADLAIALPSIGLNENNQSRNFHSRTRGFRAVATSRMCSIFSFFHLYICNIYIFNIYVFVLCMSECD